MCFEKDPVWIVQFVFRSTKTHYLVINRSKTLTNEKKMRFTANLIITLFALGVHSAEGAPVFEETWTDVCLNSCGASNTGRTWKVESTGQMSGAVSGASVSGGSMSVASTSACGSRGGSTTASSTFDLMAGQYELETTITQKVGLSDANCGSGKKGKTRAVIHIDSIHVLTRAFAMNDPCAPMASHDQSISRKFKVNSDKRVKIILETESQDCTSANAVYGTIDVNVICLYSTAKVDQLKEELKNAQTKGRVKELEKQIEAAEEELC